MVDDARGSDQKVQRKDPQTDRVDDMKRTPCVVSVAEHTGWAHFVCVAARGNVPAVIERRRVRLIDQGLPTQPYEHDSRAMREDDANALIARVRRSIAARAFDALQPVATELAPAYAVVALAIRQPPFAELPRTVAEVWRDAGRVRASASENPTQNHGGATAGRTRDMRMPVQSARTANSG